ncbi:MAG: PIN domain-containing protein [Nitrospirota bacterium]
MKIFVDTGAFYAIKAIPDENHKHALSFQTKIKGDDTIQLITTNFVLAETYTLLKSKLGQTAAVEFGEMIRKTKKGKVVRVSEDMEENAWQIFKKYADKKLVMLIVQVL